MPINYLAVLVAAIVSMILGALWYSPLLFGKIWIQLMNLNEKKLQEMKNKGMGKIYAIVFIKELVIAYILALFITKSIITISGGIQIGILIWFGFIATTILASVLWENKPVKLYFINIAYHLVSIILMSLILSAWV